MPHCPPGPSSWSDQYARCNGSKTALLPLPPKPALGSARSVIVAQVKHPRSSFPPPFLSLPNPSHQEIRLAPPSTISFICTATTLPLALLFSHLHILPGSSWSPFPPFSQSRRVLYTQKPDHVMSGLRKGLCSPAPDAAILIPLYSTHCLLLSSPCSPATALTPACALRPQHFRLVSPPAWTPLSLELKGNSFTSLTALLRLQPK